jgi:2-dehydro-3-deoxygluconokinase
VIRAISIGEAMIELREARKGLFARAVAGDAFNTAVYLQRSLPTTAEVSFLTAVGDDVLSGDLLAAFQAEGLSTRLVRSAPGAVPGLYLIELDQGGERRFHYWRRASAATFWFRELTAHGGAEALAGVDLVYLSGISLAILSPPERTEALELLGRLRHRVGRVAFDPNVRLKLWPDAATAAVVTEAACRLADIVLPSLEDGVMIWGECDPARQLERYAGLGAREIALTLGPSGVVVRVDGAQEAISAAPARVVDTSGAGDSFNGAYLAARLCGADPAAAARAGLSLAARVVRHRGALIAPFRSHPRRGRPPEDTP